MLPLRDNVPTKSTPVVTIGLIVANFIVWFWELSGRGVDPCTAEGPCHVPVSIVIHPLPWYEGAFTAMFMHASWEHILGNMLFLWIFGNNIEDALGRVRFLGWYLTAGLFATATQAVVTLSAGSVTDASIFIREIPAHWFLLIWIGLQAWSGGLALLSPQAGGGTAFFAHIGGFVFGATTIRFLVRRRPEAPTSRYPVY